MLTNLSSLFKGSRPLPCRRVIYAITAVIGFTLCLAGWNIYQETVLTNSYEITYFYQLLLPTLLMALLCGSLLAQSGAVVQTSLGNAFASPSTIGISAGALLGAMVINLVLDDPSIWQVWMAAFVFALVISMLILLLSQVIGGGKLQLILIGMAMSLAVGSLSSAIMIYAEQRMDGLFLWGSGNIGQTDGQLVSIILLPSLLLLALPLFCHRQLDMLSLGDDTANVVGLSVRRWRAILLLIAVLQASLVTAMVGVLGFVGLMAPHIARMLGFNKTKQQLICASVFGALLVIAAELFSRSLPISGFRLPTGVLTVLLGMPFFLYLLTRKKGAMGMAMQESGFGLAALIKLPKFFAIAIPATLVVLTAMKFWPSEVGFEFTAWRMAVAVMAGIGLGMAGCALQALFRNPMASPDISGATSASVLCIIGALQIWPDSSRVDLFLWALVGAGIVVCILFIAMRYQLRVSQLALLGIAISAWCGTIASMVLTFGAGAASVTVLWLTGTTYGADAQIGWLLMAVTVPCCLALLALARNLDLFTLGEDWGLHLGQPLMKLRLLIILLVVLLTAAAVAAVGAIAFVGLLSPHILRLLGQTRHWVLLLGSGLVGAWLLLLADGLGRTLIAPFEIASGILVSIIGGLYFIGLILLGYRRK
ncbi:iron ABC transporter permease [Psychromonas algicola]|uniref:iron ABC transporter permease n=1 Tax=Psychromonas algicola TaxID=2555642 RepID=UPI00106816EA|nr:iron ABC transporter permease [Psychromonas sp. RZ5]TEW51790.1 iron ABC transporter permease [Psychromonas sp. RZ5]